MKQENSKSVVKICKKALRMILASLIFIPILPFVLFSIELHGGEWQLALLSVDLVITVIVAGAWYFKKPVTNFLLDGFVLGLLWVPLTGLFGLMLMVSSGYLLRLMGPGKNLQAGSAAIPKWLLTAKGVLLGLVMWAVHLASIPLTGDYTGLMHNNLPLFFSFLAPPAILAAATVLCTALYLKSFEGNFVQEGIWLGTLWLTMNVTLDLMASASRLLSGFLYASHYVSPDLYHYFLANAPAYLAIPLITINAGYFLSREENKLAKGLVYAVAIYYARAFPWVWFSPPLFKLLKIHLDKGDITGGIVSALLVMPVATFFWFRNAKSDFIGDGYMLGITAWGLTLLANYRFIIEKGPVSLLGQTIMLLIAVGSGYWLNYRKGEGAGREELDELRGVEAEA